MRNTDFQNTLTTKRINVHYHVTRIHDFHVINSITDKTLLKSMSVLERNASTIHTTAPHQVTHTLLEKICKSNTANKHPWGFKHQLRSALQTNMEKKQKREEPPSAWPENIPSLLEQNVTQVFNHRMFSRSDFGETAVKQIETRKRMTNKKQKTLETVEEK